MEESSLGKHVVEQEKRELAVHPEHKQTQRQAETKTAQHGGQEGWSNNTVRYG